MQLPNVHVEVPLILGHLTMPPKVNRKPLGVIKRKILDRSHLRLAGPWNLLCMEKFVYGTILCSSDFVFGMHSSNTRSGTSHSSATVYKIDSLGASYLRRRRERDPKIFTLKGKMELMSFSIVEDIALGEVASE